MSLNRIKMQYVILFVSFVQPAIFSLFYRSLELNFENLLLLNYKALCYSKN